jgi:hypothetical protein
MNINDFKIIFEGSGFSTQILSTSQMVYMRFETEFGIKFQSPSIKHDEITLEGITLIKYIY